MKCFFLFLLLYFDFFVFAKFLKTREKLNYWVCLTTRRSFFTFLGASVVVTSSPSAWPSSMYSSEYSESLFCPFFRLTLSSAVICFESFSGQTELLCLPGTSCGGGCCCIIGQSFRVIWGCSRYIGSSTICGPGCCGIMYWSRWYFAGYWAGKLLLLPFNRPLLWLKMRLSVSVSESN